VVAFFIANKIRANFLPVFLSVDPRINITFYPTVSQRKVNTLWFDRLEMNSDETEKV